MSNEFAKDFEGLCGCIIWGAFRIFLNIFKNQLTIRMSVLGSNSGSVEYEAGLMVIRGTPLSVVRETEFLLPQGEGDCVKEVFSRARFCVCPHLPSLKDPHGRAMSVQSLSQPT